MMPTYCAQKHIGVEAEQLPAPPLPLAYPFDMEISQNLQY